MIFRPELASLVMLGRKHVTRRVVSHKPRSPWHPDRAPALVGREVAICPGRGKPAIGRALILAVDRERIFWPSRITDAELALEGFDSRSAFMGAWASMHRSLSYADVWRIAFVVVSRADEPR